MIDFVTQKARGISVISSMNTVFPRWIKSVKTFYTLPYNIAPHYEFPLFARPCPERPRHGFVDSRPVHNLQELLNVWVEARNADEKAELVLMPILSGKCSAIATDAGVTWGLGNDGVTSGKGKQWDIPCGNESITKLVKGWSYLLNKDIKESLYIEIVENCGNPTIVQLRDGPKLAAASGMYVPHNKYVVTNIIMNNGGNTNLVAWEKTIAEAPTGTVVVLPNSSLSSHFAVHAIINKHAVITGKSKDIIERYDSLTCKLIPKVKIGDVLEPEVNHPEPLRSRDYRAMRLMMRRKLPFHREEAAGFSTATLHAMNNWGRERHLLAFRILGAMTMFRLLTAACAGEARHANRCKRDFKDSIIEWGKLTESKSGQKIYDLKREEVFEEALKLSLEKCVTLIDQTRQELCGAWGHIRSSSNQTKFDDKGEIILQENNEPEDRCGFGGPKWRHSAECALLLGAALKKFQKEPTEENWKIVSLRYNQGVLCGHNGGRVLDKFMSWGIIDLCAKIPQFGFISKTAMETIMMLKNKGTDEAEIDETKIVGRKMEAA